jgi:exodeoxyribonuclease VII small subunit
MSPKNSKIPSEDLTYEIAFQELKEIALEIENDSVSVDVLAEKVKRASELIQFCQIKLRSTEAEISSIIKQMENKSA